MLSRVAAVKAPRTHNYRRVTGSSGRRREGRESERQRPNMSRRVFPSAVLLLVVMICCGIGVARAKKVGDPKPMVIFVWWERRRLLAHLRGNGYGENSFKFFIGRFLVELLWLNCGYCQGQLGSPF
ncbi:trans-sialidase [Trypanosoma cruzi]|nr:trans-sialidase [Trypanosoma cruzi]